MDVPLDWQVFEYWARLVKKKWGRAIRKIVINLQVSNVSRLFDIFSFFLDVEEIRKY